MKTEEELREGGVVGSEFLEPSLEEAVTAEGNMEATIAWKSFCLPFMR